MFTAASVGVSDLFGASSWSFVSLGSDEVSGSASHGEEQEEVGPVVAAGEDILISTSLATCLS
jgi:hypothetical protein